MNSLTGHIVRRGVEVIDIHQAAHQSSGGHRKHGDESLLTPVAIATLAFTSILFFITMVMTSYTYGHLIPVLAMVETPTALLIESTTTEEKEDSLDKEPLLEQCEVTLVQQNPITSSIRTTLQHLRETGGLLGRYRGFSMMAVYLFLCSQFSIVFSFLPFGLGDVLTLIVLSTIRMGWTHAVVSAPSPLPWFRRLPSIKTFKAIAPIQTLAAVSEELAVAIPFLFAGALGLFESMDRQANGETIIDPEACLIKIFAVAAVFFAWIILVVVPIDTVMARIHASLIPEKEETIVSVHREALSIKEAWKSVDWNARVRVYKAYLKGFAIQMSIMILFSAVVYLQLVMFLGPKFPEVITQYMLMV
ncbi:hypothetical protein V494_04489 [Pseudogymnoascus sp. VKM F-4513 (FW-928)]|nr:hypothetical protein V494_04489 [Pseudogymnoascus sp. VKM F-4513 (FW-928)]